MVIEAHLEDNNRWFNFSFNLTDSPWCEAYSQAIQQKVACSLDATGATTLILCVDPWSMDEVNADGGEFWTKNAWRSPCDTPPWRYALANSSPLDVFCYGSKKDLAHVIVHFVHVIRDQLFNRATLGLPEGIQASGWLPNNRVLSEAQRASAIKERIHFYEHDPIGISWPGRQNAQALRDLIDFLKQVRPRPRILLLRMPVTGPMYALEGDRFPEASSFFTGFAFEHQIEYVDANTYWPQLNDAFFNDGHHMNTAGSRQFSLYLAESVLRVP